VELLKEFEPEIERMTLIPSDGGRFEVDVNGELLYSKLNSGRHAQPGEIKERMRNYLVKERKK
jgi:selenoprotein W-related protein